MKIKWLVCYTAHKMKFSIKDFFSKYDQIRSFMLIWSHLLKKSLLLENFIFCVVLLQNATFIIKLVSTMQQHQTYTHFQNNFIIFW